jgi:hypothetical protein
VIQFVHEPIEYLLKTGLPDLCMECWEKMDDGFYKDVFSPDWKMYKEQEDRKDLGFFVMRDNGKLVGYAVIKINLDIHQENQRIAVLHDIYITEKYRGHAILYFHEIEKFISLMGAYRLDVAERLSVDAERGGIGKFYNFMGFKPMEVIWSKVLGKEGEA